MTLSKTLFCFCLSFIAGIFLNSIMKIPQSIFWGFLMAGVLSILFSFFTKKELRIVGFCILFLSLGIFRLQVAEFIIRTDPIAQLNDQPEKITLTGYIAGEPDVRQAFQKLKIRINETESMVLVTAQSYPEYHYLDKIKITGKLKTPEIFEDFNYQHYLMVSGIYSLMDYPKIELIPEKHDYHIFSFAYEKILFLKSKLLTAIGTSLSAPHSFILEGMVFGNDKNIPRELKNQFNITGLSHVTAVSGANIIIIISLVMAVLLYLGFWRGQAFWFAVGFIWIYIVLIGFPASGVRAAIMGCLALLAQKLGRQNTNSRTITLAGALMLFLNPFLLVYDIGFQLSFLASLGIIHIKPLLDMFLLPKPLRSGEANGGKLKIIAKKCIKILVDIFFITLSAQIITLPIILYHFGQVSLVAPIANLFALPVVGVLTVLGFLLAIFASILPPLGFIFAVPCWFFLDYFIKVLGFFSQPWAAKAVSDMSWIWIVVYYVALIVLIKFFKKYQKPKFLGF